jgi:hypothetical protein
LFVTVGSLIDAAQAKIELQPGLWQEVEIGSENNQPVRSETTTRCMTAEEARQPSKVMVLNDELRRHCKTLSFDRAGDSITFRLQCEADALDVSMDAAFTIETPQHYRGTIKAALNLGPIMLSLDKTIDAKRIGECPEKK